MLPIRLYPINIANPHDDNEGDGLVTGTIKVNGIYFERMTWDVEQFER